MELHGAFHARGLEGISKEENIYRAFVLKELFIEFVEGFISVLSSAWFWELWYDIKYSMIMSKCSLFLSIEPEVETNLPH